MEQPRTVLDPAGLARLSELAGGDAEFVGELIDTFLGVDAPKLLVDIRVALEKGDAARLRVAAHGLKSNCRDFGAPALAQLCLELETMGKMGMLDGAAEKLTLAEAEYEQVKAALEAVRP